MTAGVPVGNNYSLVSDGETRQRFWVGVKLKGDDADYQVAVRAPGKRAAIYLALDFDEVERVTGCTTFARPASIRWTPSTESVA